MNNTPDEMRNIAYSNAYADWQAEHAQLVCDACFVSEKTKVVSDAYDLVVRRYERPLEGYANLETSVNMLRNTEGEIVYTYQSSRSALTGSIIAHSNGHSYFVFSRDLYGYSVLDLTTGQDFHYVPRASFWNAFEKETFIWTSVQYNPINSVIAVYGCFWAHPYSAILVDFTNPFMPRTWAELTTYLQDEENDDDDMMDIDAVQWDGVDLIILDCTQDEPILVKETEYRPWLDGEYSAYDDFELHAK